MNGLDNWLKTPPGRYALAWEQAQFDAVVADLFGYHALQLGLPTTIDALAANRMPHRWQAALMVPAATGAAAAQTAGTVPRIALVASPAALPFPEESLDLIALPHTLDHGSDLQATLREVKRVLVHEGRVVITGINPASLWGLTGALPAHDNDLATPHRLRALLHDTELELEIVHYGGHGFAPRTLRDEAQQGWLDRWGMHLWPTLGALWCAVAVKRSRGAMLVGPIWKNQPAGAGAQAGVAQRTKPAADGLSAKIDGF